MEWIQASKRLPSFSHRLISRFIHTQTPMFDFKEWALNNPEKLNLVEWLDESTPSLTIKQGLDIWDAAQDVGINISEGRVTTSFPDKAAYFASIGIDIENLK